MGRREEIEAEIAALKHELENLPPIWRYKHNHSDGYHLIEKVTGEYFIVRSEDSQKLIRKLNNLDRYEAALSKIVSNGWAPPNDDPWPGDDAWDIANEALKG